MSECPHDRVVRLSVPGTSGPMDYWICNQCNEEFLMKKQVNWRIVHLTKELQKLVAQGTATYEQVAGVWREESVSTQEGS